MDKHGLNIKDDEQDFRIRKHDEDDNKELV